MKSITNDEMAMTLVSFWSNDDGDEKYDEFRIFWRGILTMVVGRYSLGWITEISPAGYEQVAKAFAELVELGYVDEQGNLLDIDGLPYSE